jgi:hypothetical protein
MFAVIYRFKLKPENEELFKACWKKVTDYFIEHRGATGSCLHKGQDNLWVAYSRWPDKATRDASWPGNEDPSNALPQDIRKAIQKMQTIKKESDSFEDICLDVVEDKLLS